MPMSGLCLLGALELLTAAKRATLSMIQETRGAIMILSNWWYAAGTIFAVMATPGPAMLLGLAVATQHGARRALLVGSGVLMAFSMFAVVSLSGIGALLLAEPRVLLALQWFGIVYLAWLGTNAFIRFTNASAGSSLSNAVREAENSGSYFRHGFLMSLSNMNAILFFCAIIPQFINADAPILPQVVLLYVTFCSCWFAAFMGYVLVGTAIRQYFAGSSVTRWLHLVSGAVYFAAAGMLSLRR
jgi:homoserine/homoserine lactone efflux protein